jgi:hypothetical protein
VALGQVLSEYLGFLCRFPFYQLLHIHLSSSSSRTVTVGPVVARVTSGRSHAPPYKLKRKQHCAFFFPHSSYRFYVVYVTALTIQIQGSSVSSVELVVWEVPMPQDVKKNTHPNTNNQNTFICTGEDVRKVTKQTNTAKAAYIN